MKTFYLQQREVGGPWLIDDTFPWGCARVSESVEASEWLEAKKKFGYPLTPIQEWLLAEHQRVMQ